MHEINAISDLAILLAGFFVPIIIIACIELFD